MCAAGVVLASSLGEATRRHAATHEARAQGTGALPPAVAASGPAVFSQLVAPPLVVTEEPPATATELEMNTDLRSEGAPPGRTVFIDGKPVGKTPLDVTVPCGGHTLQMAAGAPKQPVELPCGGRRVVRYDATGHWTLR